MDEEKPKEETPSGSIESSVLETITMLGRISQELKKRQQKLFENVAVKEEK